MADPKAKKKQEAAERKRRNTARWRKNNSERNRELNRAWAARNPEKIKASNAKWARAWAAQNPERVMWLAAKNRAAKDGREFNIEITDIVIPEHCPVLGIPLLRAPSLNKIGWREKDSRASLDRIDNSKGYVKGNVVVVSYRANRLKADASLAELQQIVAFYEGKL